MIHCFELEKITCINNYQTQQIMTNKFFSFYLGQRPTLFCENYYFTKKITNLRRNYYGVKVKITNLRRKKSKFLICEEKSRVKLQITTL